MLKARHIRHPQTNIREYKAQQRSIFIYILHYAHPKSFIELPVRPQKGTTNLSVFVNYFREWPNLLQLSSCSIDAASCFRCFFFTDKFSFGRSLELFDSSCWVSFSKWFAQCLSQTSFRFRKIFPIESNRLKSEELYP